jgi:hypothetical protein
VTRSVLLFLLASLATIGCDNLDMHKPDSDGVVEQGGPSSPAQPGPASIQSANLEANIKVEVKGGDPEKYIIQFSWPVIEDGKIIRVRDKSVLTEVQPSQSFFTHQVNHDQNITYYFDVLSSSKSIERTIAKSVLIPKDYVVREGSDRLTADTTLQVNRLFLGPDIPLTSLNYNLTIFASELHSEGGIIRTFPAGSRGHGSIAMQPVDPPIFWAPNGLSGGTITIRSKTLFGQLHVELRGEDGADGRDGVAVTERPPQAAPGTRGSISCESTQDGGQGQCTCGAYGNDGGQGVDGARGESAIGGGSGGNSGDLKVAIQSFLPQVTTDPTYPNETLNPVEVIISAGAPGHGGTGAPGQPGGLGGIEGPGGSYDCSGDAGKNGSDGPPGRSVGGGQPGTIGQKCVYIGSENINECVQ